VTSDRDSGSGNPILGVALLAVCGGGGGGMPLQFEFNLPQFAITSQQKPRQKLRA
jgi:hypothetical protein